MASFSGEGNSLKDWMRWIGHAQWVALLTLFYIFVWVPAGLLSRLFADWLRRRPPAKTNWQARPDRVNQPETLRDPF